MPELVGLFTRSQGSHLGGVSVLPAPFQSMHMREERALGSRKFYIRGWRQVRPRSRVQMFWGRSGVKSEKSPRGGSFACETWLLPLGS